MTYERFTDRARKVMQLANQEAQRMNHEYVGPEHVLLGLVKEGSGLAAHALIELGMDLKNLRSKVEEVAPSSPDATSFGKMPYSPATNRLLESAMAKSRDMGHIYVGTEHLLLGLIDGGVRSIACKAIHNWCALATVEAKVVQFLEKSKEQKLFAVGLCATLENTEWFQNIVEATVKQERKRCAAIVRNYLRDGGFARAAEELASMIEKTG